MPNQPAYQSCAASVTKCVAAGIIDTNFDSAGARAAGIIIG